MMKKRLAVIMLAGMMMGISPVGVMAAETEVTTESSAADIVLSYEDMDPNAYEGTWISTGLGFDLYLPSDWDVLEVSDENAKQGIVYQAADSAKGWNIAVSYNEGMQVTVDDIYKQLGDAGYKSLYKMDLNGIPAVGFDIDDQKVSGVAFADADGGMYTVQLGPNDDKDFEPIMKNIFMSISPTTAESEAETEALFPASESACTHREGDCTSPVQPPSLSSAAWKPTGSSSGCSDIIRLPLFPGRLPSPVLSVLSLLFLRLPAFLRRLPLLYPQLSDIPSSPGRSSLHREHAPTRRFPLSPRPYRRL